MLIVTRIPRVSPGETVTRLEVRFVEV